MRAGSSRLATCSGCGPSKGVAPAHATCTQTALAPRGERRLAMILSDVCLPRGSLAAPRRVPTSVSVRHIDATHRCDTSMRSGAARLACRADRAAASSDPVERPPCDSLDERGSGDPARLTRPARVARAALPLGVAPVQRKRAAAAAMGSGVPDPLRPLAERRRDAQATPMGQSELAVQTWRLLLQTPDACDRARRTELAGPSNFTAVWSLQEAEYIG